MIYETDDEIRYRINQNVRYLLSLSDQSANSAASVLGKGGAESVVGSTDAINVPNQDQVRESVLRFFHLIHHVIFSKSQPSWDCKSRFLVLLLKVLLIFFPYLQCPNSLISWKRS